MNIHFYLLLNGQNGTTVMFMCIVFDQTRIWYLCSNTIKLNPPVLPQQSSPFSGHRRLVRLSPDSEYEVRLRGRNRFGWAEEEAKFRFNTSRNGERSATPGSVFFFFSGLIRQFG